jgi:hypothetical protein
LVGIDTSALLDARYEKFRRMGVFLESPPSDSAVGPSDLESAAGEVSDAPDVVAQAAAAGKDPGETTG